VWHHARVDAATDPFDLDRFVSAQAPMLDAVLAELTAGDKQSHWMWFVFPQLKGLGRSTLAFHYGIGSMAEARAYLAHPVLGPRLRHCCELMLAVPEKSASEILGSPDDAKFRSCLTLFLQASGDDLFQRALDRFYAGQPDPRTIALCAKEQ
jgi:uncharacterized protein (DUF1810 family)